MNGLSPTFSVAANATAVGLIMVCFLIVIKYLLDQNKEYFRLVVDELKRKDEEQQKEIDRLKEK